MSILIPDMKMPKNCKECDFGIFDDVDSPHYCCVTGEDICDTEYEEKRMDNCHLIELPKHGRLIDADALKNSIANIKHIDNANPHIMTAWREINLAPTIIEAEENKNG